MEWWSEEAERFVTGLYQQYQQYVEKERRFQKRYRKGEKLIGSFLERMSLEAPRMIEVTPEERRAYLYWLVDNRRPINTMKLADGRVGIDFMGVPVVIKKER